MVSVRSIYRINVLIIAMTSVPVLSKPSIKSISSFSHTPEKLESGDLSNNSGTSDNKYFRENYTKLETVGKSERDIRKHVENAMVYRADKKVVESDESNTDVENNEVSDEDKLSDTVLDVEKVNGTHSASDERVHADTVDETINERVNGVNIDTVNGTSVTSGNGTVDNASEEIRTDSGSEFANSGSSRHRRSMDRMGADNSVLSTCPWEYVYHTGQGIEVFTDVRCLTAKPRYCADECTNQCQIVYHTTNGRKRGVACVEVELCDTHINDSSPFSDGSGVVG